VPFGRIRPVLCDTMYIGVGFSESYGQQCYVYGWNRKPVQCVAVSAVLCDIVYTGIWG